MVETIFEKIYSGVVICLSPNKSGVEKVNYKESTLSLLKDPRIIKILCGLFLSSIFTQFIAVSYSYMYSLVSQDNSVGKLVCLVCAVVVILGISSLLKGRLMKKFNLIYEKIYGNVMTDRLVNKNYKFFSIRNNGDLLYRVNARGAIKESVLMKIVPAIISSCTVIVVLFLLYKNNSVMGLMLNQEFMRVVQKKVTPTQLQRELGLTSSTYYRYRKNFFENFPEFLQSV